MCKEYHHGRVPRVNRRSQLPTGYLLKGAPMPLPVPQRKGAESMKIAADAFAARIRGDRHSGRRCKSHAEELA
jgi:hypothetical protein